MKWNDMARGAMKYELWGLKQSLENQYYVFHMISTTFT